MQRPDHASLQKRLAARELTSPLDLIDTNDLTSMRSVILTFDDQGNVRSLAIELFMKQGMGCLEFRKAATTTTALVWHELPRESLGEAVSIPMAGAMDETSGLTIPVATLHDASLAAKIFSAASLPRDWNVTHSKASGLRKTIVRIQPDYGCLEHRIEHAYCTQWLFEKNVMHLLYRRPDGRVEADFWTRP